MYKRNVIGHQKRTLEEGEEAATKANKLANMAEKEAQEVGNPPAICPICKKKFDVEDLTSCKECENGHKFHSTCYPEHSKCPICESEKIETFSNTDDTFSGGKKKRKTKKKIRKIKSFKKRREKNKRKTKTKKRK